MKKYHYLKLKPSALLWPIVLIYSGIVVIRAMSLLPILEISIWYWSILGPIALLSYFGIWTELEKDTLVYRVFFMRRLRIPIKNILRIMKGPPYGLARTDCMYCYYQDEGDKEKYVITVLFNHKSQEIAKFISDLVGANQKIFFDENLKNWLAQQKTPVN